MWSKLRLLNLIFLLLPVISYAQTTTSYEDQFIEQRIKPLGQVYIQGQSTEEKKPAVAATPNATLSGADVYAKYCVTCHGSGLAGAPKVHDQKDWGPRLKKGIDGLVKSSETGLNVMPPKGTCQECTETQLKQAIEFMTSKS